MPDTLQDLATEVRSKNAGPFWITVDLFFDDADTYARHSDDPALGAGAIADLYGVDVAQVKRFKIDSLNVVKLSFPRLKPQGGALERDMHGGQQFVPMLDLELA